MTTNPSDWELFQIDLMRVHNTFVKEHFKDIADLSATASPGQLQSYLSNARARLRYNCLIRDDDSALIALNKQLFFWMALKGGDTLLPPIYAHPTSLWEEEITYKPQIQLVFRQDAASVAEGEVALDSQISFRLMNETVQTMTPAKAELLAARIKTLFATGNGYTYSKGKFYAYYTDKELGYDLRILVIGETEGRQIIEKVLDIQSHTFKNECFRISEPKRNNNAPRTQRRIYNVNRKEKRWRPNAVLRFRSAFLYLHGYGRPITLIDKTGRYVDGLAF